MGKSAHFSELAAKMETFILNSSLERLYLDDNNLRAANGERILKAICSLKNLTHLSLSQNFLG